MQLSVEKIWDSAQEQLRSKLSRDTFNMWFAPLRACAIDAHQATLEAPNEFCEVWVKDNYLSLLQDAFAIANTAAMSPEDLEQQERRHDFIRLQRGSQAKAFEDGQASGRAEGQAEGEQAKALAVARNLLPMLEDAAIAAATGLSEETVARMRTEVTNC